MKFPTVAVALQFLASCWAYTLPEDLPDGVYQVTLNEEGHEIHQGLSVDYNTTLTN
jgi:hypothetical protein